jgi:hypothetical protein
VIAQRALVSGFVLLAIGALNSKSATPPDKMTDKLTTAMAVQGKVIALQADLMMTTTTELTAVGDIYTTRIALRHQTAIQDGSHKVDKAEADLKEALDAIVKEADAITQREKETNRNQ